MSASSTWVPTGPTYFVALWNHHAAADSWFRYCAISRFSRILNDDSPSGRLVTPGVAPSRLSQYRVAGMSRYTPKRSSVHRDNDLPAIHPLFGVPA
jgi:hypothetical protein